jgi:L-fuculose-phosphate aldolase
VPPGQDPPAAEATRAAVARAARRLAEEGLVVGTAGNVSARVPDSDHLAVTGSGVVLADCTAADVVLLGPGESPREATSELELHRLVAERSGAAAVVHTHAPAATAVGCVLDTLPVIHYQQLLLGGEIRVAPYATFGSPELAAHVARAIEGRSAALMANHGAVNHAATLDRAVEGALLLEWCARLYLDAARLGTPRVLDEQQQAAVIEAAIARSYGGTHA